MSEAQGTGKGFDVFEPWRGMRDAYLEAWSKAMIEAVNSQEYAAATGAMLDTYLTASAPFREALEKAMAQSMQQVGLPTRDDVTSLAERLTNVEMRLDDMDAALTRIERALSRISARAERARPQADREQK